MSNRTERREAERLARKLACQQLRQQQPAISEAQLAANRANSQHSTGPVTPEGRAKSSQNALTHALTGKTVLLPDDDPAEYQQELDMHLEIYHPVGTEETRLVQSILGCNWRLKRIQSLETAILYKGQIECADKFADKSNVRSEIERRHFVKAEAYLMYERQLRNLHIQEARIRRTMDKCIAELKTLQTERERHELAEAEAHIQPPKSATAAANGFDFSSEPNHPLTDSLGDPEHAFDGADTRVRSVETPLEAF